MSEILSDFVKDSYKADKNHLEIREFEYLDISIKKLRFKNRKSYFLQHSIIFC